MLDPTAIRETIVVTHTDNSGTTDYTIKLTFAYHEEEGQWVGFCEELGTSAFADDLEQTKVEIREAVELQLNGVERITDVRGYLADNQVVIQPVKLSRQAGFAVVWIFQGVISYAFLNSTVGSENAGPTTESCSTRISRRKAAKVHGHTGQVSAVARYHVGTHSQREANRHWPDWFAKAYRTGTRRLIYHQGRHVIAAPLW